MSPGLMMERVYEALKRQIMAGAWHPQQRLDPARLAADLNASTTPVRDALHRLMGERMVEGWPHDGFHVPACSEIALRDLYAWNLELLLLCTRRNARHGKPTDAPGAIADGNLAQQAADLFAHIADAAGNDEFRRAVANSNDRLHVVRLAEASVIAGAEAEHAAMADALARANMAALRQGLARYHRRRSRQVAPICAALHAGSGAWGNARAS